MKTGRMCAAYVACLIASLATWRMLPAAEQNYLPPVPSARASASPPTRAISDSDRAQKPEYAYGIGYAAPWQPVSGKHWRKGARLEYYSNPPAPTWRWFTTGRGCPYDPGLHYGIGYPFTMGYTYPKYKRD